jgi:hypothetical protein
MIISVINACGGWKIWSVRDTDMDFPGHTNLKTVLENGGITWLLDSNHATAYSQWPVDPGWPGSPYADRVRVIILCAWIGRSWRNKRRWVSANKRRNPPYYRWTPLTTNNLCNQLSIFNAWQSLTTHTFWGYKIDIPDENFSYHS